MTRYICTSLEPDGNQIPFDCHGIARSETLIYSTLVLLVKVNNSPRFDENATAETSKVSSRLAQPGSTVALTGLPDTVMLREREIVWSMKLRHLIDLSVPEFCLTV